MEELGRSGSDEFRCFRTFAVAGEILERELMHKKFSRRRTAREGEDVDFINDRNKVFNKKLKRSYDKYTVEIRQNFERGTAI